MYRRSRKPWLALVKTTAGAIVTLIFGGCALYVLNAVWLDDLPKTSGFEFERMMATSPIAFSSLALLLGGAPAILGVALVLSGWRDWSHKR